MQIFSNYLLSQYLVLIYIFDDGTGEENYKHINRIILDFNVMKMSLIIVEGKYGAISADDSSCYVYYIIKFSSSPYPSSRLDY